MNGPRDGRLAAHRIDGDHPPREGEHLEQCGNGGDFVGFGVRLHLAQTQPLRRGPGAHHVNRGFVGDRIKGPAQGLAVDGDHVPGQSLRHRGDPDEKGRLERLRIQRREDATERIVRQDAMRQGQEATKPFSFGLADVGDRDPVVGPADHRAQRDHENVFQGMPTRAPDARVRQLAEGGGDR